MVEKPSRRLANGAVVDIVDRDEQWVGRGLYNGHSRIALRVLTTQQDEAIDAGFFAKKIERAVSLRRDLLKLDAVTDAYRLIHSEADGLSGLVVDRFGSTLVLEFFAAGMYRLRDMIQAELQKHFPEAGFWWFAEEHVGKQESFDCRSPEPPSPMVITEHVLRFRVAPGSKHKTGFFADKRDNRKTLSGFCEGKRVLDLCCNTGGFSVYAKALGKASEVIGVDLDIVKLDARSIMRVHHDGALGGDTLGLGIDQKQRDAPGLACGPAGARGVVGESAGVHAAAGAVWRGELRRLAHLPFLSLPPARGAGEPVEGLPRL